MAEHNGDYSPEAERARQLKREKMQRRRIRQRIDEGRATDVEREAMAIWDAGSEAWDAIAQALTEVKASVPAQVPSGAARAPRKPRARPVAQEETPGEQGEGWGSWVGWAGVAAFVGAVLWAAIRNG